MVKKKGLKMADKPNIKKMCLICMDRTGSNMISSRLNTHPRIRFYNELFHRQYVIFQDDRVNGSVEMVSKRDRDPAAFISQVWSGGYEPSEDLENIDGIGFKLFINHNAEALRYVVNTNAKLIFLRRRNPLLRFSSFKIAVRTGEWKRNEANGEAPAKKAKVKFHAPEFRAYMNNFQTLETLLEMTLNRWNRKYFNVWYEDFVQQDIVWKNLVRYLGYDVADFGESPLLKQNTDDVAARFSNPDDVREYVEQMKRYDWLQ
ncbi:MAG: hypothetical protein CSA85_00715 [Alphaproteobacteria bacterium]|nr:MAG: hypothetical protein CSA85_00715 [Alphaproteobacteria bacterium]